MTARRLRVLTVTSSPDIGRAVELVVAGEGDDFEGVGTVEAALASVSVKVVDVAFVDVDADGGAALALVHHLPALCPGIVVHALASPRQLERGVEALSLGAAGVIIAPPTGDAIGRALDDVKATAVHGARVRALEEELARERKKVHIYDRIVRVASDGVQSDVVRAIVEGISQMGGATGVALYATVGDTESERVRLAAVGSSSDLPATALPADLSRLVEACHARLVPLVAAGGELGVLVIEHGRADVDADIAGVAELASAMLSLVDRQDLVDQGARVVPLRLFGAIADRILTLASRHDRRASVLAISLAGADAQSRREEATREMADVIRGTDALCGTEGGDLLIFLPETTGLGAHACRRRILARLTGERRARPKASPVRPQEPHAKTGAISVSVGVSTYPHDGATLSRLVKTARARLADDARSPVHALALDAMALPDVVDALIARPMLDAGPRSPYPLDLAGSALFALVTRACREALRGGETTVVTTLQPGLGVAAAARQVTSPKVLDVTREPGCANLEAIVVEAEHGAWVCCGRMVGERFRGVHCADPLLADVLTRRITAAGSAHAG